MDLNFIKNYDLAKKYHIKKRFNLNKLIKYKYFKFRYRYDLGRKFPWVPMRKYKNREYKYVWHEDVAKFRKVYNCPEMTKKEKESKDMAKINKYINNNEYPFTSRIKNNKI